MYFQVNRIEIYTPHEQMIIRYYTSKYNYIVYDDIPREQLSLMDDEKKKILMKKDISPSAYPYMNLNFKDIKRIVREENLEHLVNGNKKFKKNWVELLPMIYNSSISIFNIGILKNEKTCLYGQEDVVRYICEFF